MKILCDESEYHSELQWLRLLEEEMLRSIFNDAQKMC